MNDFDLKDFLPYRLNRVSEWISHRFSQYYREKYQMSRWEWRTLANLCQHGCLTAKQITGYGNMYKTKVSRAVASLKQREWLKNETDNQDARVEWLSLTKSGLSVFGELTQECARFDRELSKKLGKDNLEVLKSGLKTLEKLVEQGTHD